MDNVVSSELAQRKELTMSKKKRQHPPEFKAKVALAAMKNEETISALAARFGVHPTMINNWKRALLDGAADIFDKGINPGKTRKPKSTNCIVRSESFRWNAIF